jgi:hypothetical protein
MHIHKAIMLIYIFIINGYFSFYSIMIVLFGYHSITTHVLNFMSKKLNKIFKWQDVQKIAKDFGGFI